MNSFIVLGSNRSWLFICMAISGDFQPEWFMKSKRATPFAEAVIDLGTPVKSFYVYSDGLFLTQ